MDRLIITKKCIRCGRNIRTHNESSLCNGCYHLSRAVRNRSKKKLNKLCYDCGKKVNPIINYPNGEKGPKEIKYPTCCYKCRLKRVKKSHLKVKTKI